MLPLIIAIFTVLVVLLASEYLWRRKIISGELGRKFVHIVVGGFVALLPLFLSWRQIQLLSLCFMAVVLIAKRYKIFHAIFDVKRRTYGEFLYAVGIFAASLMATAPWVFTAAVLTMSVSDGLAAIVGKRYGASNVYMIFGYVKSVAGSLAFFITTVTLLATLALVLGDAEKWLLIKPYILPIGLVVTAVEALSVKGTDNITVPVMTVLLLRLMGT